MRSGRTCPHAGSGAEGLLLIAPHEWEEHQQPQQTSSSLYTRYGLEYLLSQSRIRRP